MVVPHQRWFISGTVFFLCVLINSPATAADQSVIAPLASKSLLLDIAVAGDSLIAVGERGHVLRSHDQGVTWSQLQVPTRATLTGITFANRNLGFIVGHDAIILRTDDGGETWTRVHEAPEEERPLLDVYARDKNTVIAIGAYGYYLESIDGGESWESRVFKAIGLDEAPDSDEIDDEFGDDFHLNHFAVSDNGKWYMAAEAGSVYRSDNDGEQWMRLDSPYAGSFFGVLPLAGDNLLLFGLQGRLFHSDDAGRTWKSIESHTRATLTAAAQLPTGSIVIVGYAGAVLVDAHGDNNFVLKQQPLRAGISAIVPTGPDGIVLVGEGGIRRLSGVL